MKTENSLCIGTKMVNFVDRNGLPQNGTVMFLENGEQLLAKEVKPNEVEGKIVHYISKKKGETYKKSDGSEGEYETTGLLFQFVQSRVTEQDLLVARLEALKARIKAFDEQDALNNLPG